MVFVLEVKILAFLKKKYMAVWHGEKWLSGWKCFAAYIVCRLF
jgi:hypothetical protein